MAPSPLLSSLREKLRAQHYARKTVVAYVGWVKQYIAYHRRVHPLSLGAADVSAFLTDLAIRRRVAASTQNQARGKGSLVVGNWWSGTGEWPDARL